MRLYLVRHAKPVVPEGVCYGSADLPADADHQRQVMAGLAGALPRGTPVFCSPSQRCRMLADALARELAAGEPICDARLAEMDFGAWEMQAWDAIPRNEVDAWAENLNEYCPGGGESLLDMARRVSAFGESLRSTKLDAAIVVCHAGTIRMLLAKMHCTSLEEMVAHASRSANRIPYGAMIAMTIG